MILVRKQRQADLEAANFLVTPSLTKGYVELEYHYSIKDINAVFKAANITPIAEHEVLRVE